MFKRKKCKYRNNTNIMCSPSGLICILITSLFYNCCFYTVVANKVATKETLANVNKTYIPFDINKTANNNFHNPTNVDNTLQAANPQSHSYEFENPIKHINFPTHSAGEYKEGSSQSISSNSRSVDDGQFIDITRKHKIHYNGIVVSIKFYIISFLFVFHLFEFVIYLRNFFF